MDFAANHLPLKRGFRRGADLLLADEVPMKSLRTRLLVLLLSLLGVVLAVFCTVVYLLVRATLQGDIDQFVLDKALLLGREVNPINPAWVRFEERDWRARRFTPVGQIFDAEWRPLFVSKRLSAPIPPTEQLKREATHPLGVVHHDAIAPDGERYRMATITERRDGKFLCYAQIGVSLNERDRDLRRLLAWLIGGSVFTWVGALVASGYLLQQWRMPLAMLGETARRVSVQNLSRQRLFAPPDAPELAPVAQAFNELLDTLESAHTTQQRFVADASHELRTPLTILRGEIDVALRRERTPAEYQEVLQSNREEIDRLSRLVENLLALARADAGEALARSESVDLAGVAREVCDKLKPLAARQRVSLCCEAADPAPVAGDPIGLERVLFNLIENALRYGPADETVSVRVTQDERFVKAEVEDRGSGIAAEHLPHVFDRFYRVDKARSRDFGGAGLGLSIVRTLVEAHGGRIEARSVVGKGSTFTVRLPRGGGSARD